MMDQLTFKETVFVHKDKLYRLAKRMLANPDEAFDVVQDVMVKLWQNREHLTVYKSIEAFSMQCVKNECYNRLKHTEVILNHQKSFTTSSKNEHNIGDNTKAVIIELINELPPKQKMVIHLKDVEEYEIAEIAEIMELEENAIRINLMRARQKIKVQLEKLFEYEQRRI